MGFNESNLGQAQIGAGSPTTIYTVAAGKTGIVRDILICNTTVNDRTVEVWIDVNGMQATDAEAIISGLIVRANDFVHISGFWVVISSGGTIKAQASVGSSLTITVSGALLS